jgi:hypothetical protein
MRSLTSLDESRAQSPENFRSLVQKDFCNNIDPKRKSAALRQGLSGCEVAHPLSSPANSAKRVFVHWHTSQTIVVQSTYPSRTSREG